MKRIERKIAVLIIGLIFALSPFLSASATVTVTPATGGSAISADTTGGTYTSLTGPVISEGLVSEINTGTIILDVPSGFIFDTGGTAPIVLVTRTAGSGSDTRNINNVASGTSIPITSRTTTQITFTVTDATSGGVMNSLTWQNIRVRPSAGTPLASGNITKSGTSAINGITNGTTNLGILTEVVGAKSQLVITTQPSTSVTAATDFGTKPVIAVRDQFNNTVTSDNTTAIILTALLSTQACGGTAGSGTLTSVPASGAAVSLGVMTYTAMQYSVAENVNICFFSSGVASALSNVITITTTSSPPPPIPIPSPTFFSTPGGAPVVSNAYFYGQVYPGSKIDVLRKSNVVGQYESVPFVESKIASDGTFSVTIKNFLQAEYFFAIRAADRNERQSRILPLVSQFVPSGNNLILKDIFIPPTIEVTPGSISQGQPLKVLGYAAPSSIVEVLIDEATQYQTTADISGFYTFATSTTSFSLDNHTVKARFVLPNGAKSDFSIQRVFRVSPLAFPKTDLNGDNAVNISDWSIFLFRWESSDTPLKKSIDFNNDGKVNISDLSIFLESMRMK